MNFKGVLKIVKWPFLIGLTVVCPGHPGRDHNCKFRCRGAASILCSIHCFCYVRGRAAVVAALTISTAPLSPLWGRNRGPQPISATRPHPQSGGSKFG